MLLSENVVRLLDFELLDRKGDVSKFEALLEQEPLNNRMVNMIKSGFPMTSTSDVKTFFRIKAKNAEKLKVAFENFIQTALHQLVENPSVSQLRDQILSSSIQVGHVGDNCIVMFNLTQMDLTRSLSDMVEALEKQFRHIKAQFNAGVGTALSFKDIMEKVYRDKGNDPAGSEKMKEETNLLKHLLGGAAVRGRVDISRQSLHRVREMIAEIVVRSRYKNDKLLDFLVMAFRGVAMKVKLSDNDTYSFVSKVLNRNKGAFPDGADIVDEIGMLLSNTRLIEYYDNVPYIREFVDALREHARASIEFGLTFDKATASISLQTEGIKELFDHIMAGMQ